jgi:hypothetical protein
MLRMSYLYRGSIVAVCVLLCACTRNENALTKQEIPHERARSLRDPFVPVGPAQAIFAQAEPHARIQDIQAALKKAGFYDGVIDGALGKKTSQAIKDFQKAHNLASDGKVGVKTWQLLSRYR